MPYQPVDIDAYSPLSHKRPLADDKGTAAVSPSWVPIEDRRRLAAYHVLAAYLNNVARSVLPVDSPHGDSLREYGDPDLLVDRIVAGVLGEAWDITVDGADLDLDLVEFPERPAAVDDATSPEGRLAALRLAAWTQRVEEDLVALEEAAEELPGLQLRQEQLRRWADAAHLSARIDEGEHDAAGLGDGIYVLWPRDGDWPAISCMDPATYFPPLDDDGAMVEYPTAVPFAWEYEVTVDGKPKRYLRRITFELVSIASVRSDGVDWVDASGMVTDTPVLGADEAILADGRIVRRYPWETSDSPEDWSDTTCVMSDGTWDLSRRSLSGLVDLSDEAATWRTLDDGTVVRDLDLQQDFLPVVHNPNTTNSKEHFGRSVLLSVAQILDDLARADTDTVQASRYLSDPTLALSGATVADGQMVVAPGSAYSLGENGRMDVLDLSAGLEKLMAHREALADRFWVNGRVPKEVIGRVDSSDVPSGVALALSFAPFAQLIGTLRMARDPKYRLLLKFAQRMAQVQGALDPGATPVARISWGNFLPTNRTETAKIVNEALTAHAISTQTAVKMLVAGGFPIDDATAEVERIMAEDFRRASAAKDIADATGSEVVAAEWFGVELPAAAPGAPAPALDLPPV